MRYRLLRNAVTSVGYHNVANGLVEITGKSKSYLEKCLCGKKSFQPSEIALILIKLDRPFEDAHELFPTLGIAPKANIDEEKTISNYMKRHTFEDLVKVINGI